MTASDADSASIAEDEVRALTRLANLELPEDEIRRLTGDLARILGHVRQLEELDVTGVPPTSHIELGRAALREDTPEPSLPLETALREAPRVSMDGFAVPGFVDED